MGTGTGTVFFLQVVSEPVSEKFGTEKSLGTGIGKIWYRKKVSEPVSEKFGTEKSTGIGIENIWYRIKVSVSVSFNILGTVTHCTDKIKTYAVTVNRTTRRLTMFINYGGEYRPLWSTQSLLRSSFIINSFLGVQYVT